MKKYVLSLCLLAGVLSACAQEAKDLINVQEATRIETTLAADDMQGRRSGTPGSDKAARFIADEFRQAGLQPLNGSFLQSFTMVSPRFVSARASFDGAAIDQKNIVVFTHQPEFSINEKSGYEISTLSNPKTGFADVSRLLQSGKNHLVLVDTALRSLFSRLPRLKSMMFPMQHNVVFVLGAERPAAFTIEARHNIQKQELANVVGILPGRSKKNEYVIFSAHYDHLGIGRAVNGDSIYNGANDDAAGTTAVIMLARYFKALGNNERTIVFAAFTAEEMGGFGSQYFSRQFNPAEVMAMFNIEMIGTESKWGTNSAFITGYEKTNMGEILQRNLQGTGFTFHPDPYPDQQLFYRSDNATLARLGVPAHTISTSKMDVEPHYHKPSDQVETLDLKNMTEIIRAIALSARSIVAGKDTPSRVNTAELR